MLCRFHGSPEACWCCCFLCGSTRCQNHIIQCITRTIVVIITITIIIVMNPSRVDLLAYREKSSSLCTRPGVWKNWKCMEEWRHCPKLWELIWNEVYPCQVMVILMILFQSTSMMKGNRCMYCIWAVTFHCFTVPWFVINVVITVV